MECRSWLRAAVTGLMALFFLPGSSVAQIPTLSFSPAGTPYTLLRKVPDVSFAFTVDSSSQTPITDLRIQWTPFIDEHGTPAETKLFVSGQPADPAKAYPISPNGRLPVEIRAKLAEPGTYTAYVTLSAGGQTGKPVTLTVNRPKPVLQLFDIPAVRFPAVSPLSAEVPVRINETSGQQVKVSPPQLMGLSIRDGDDKLGVEVTASLMNAKNEDVSGEITLSDAAVQRLRLKLEGIKEPGHYEGTLRLTAPDTTFTEKTFTVYLREPRRVAFFWIGVGVLVSFLLREYLTKSRPRLLEEVRALELLQKLEEVPPRFEDRAERNLHLTLQQQIKSVLARLGLPDAAVATVTAELDLLGKKVPLALRWIELRREAAKIDDPNARQTINAALEANRPNILLATTLAEVQAAEKALETISGQIGGVAGLEAMTPAGREAAPLTAGERAMRLLERIKSSDALVSLVALAIATILGLMTLWAKDPAWGGWEDRLLALLWGLGLDQFAFSGLKGLMTKLTS